MLAYELVPCLYGLTSAAKFNPSAPWPTLLALAAETLGLSLLLFFGALIAGLLVVGIVPRLLSPLLMQDRTYVLFGTHYFIHRVVSAVSNPRRSTSSCSATARTSSTTCNGSATG